MRGPLSKTDRAMFLLPILSQKVLKETDSAEEGLAEAKEQSSASRTALAELQNSQSTLQVELRTKGRRQSLAEAKVKQVRALLML